MPAVLGAAAVAVAQGVFAIFAHGLNIEKELRFAAAREGADLQHGAGIGA